MTGPEEHAEVERGQAVVPAVGPTVGPAVQAGEELGEELGDEFGVGIAALRTEYTAARLDEESASTDPWAQFTTWFADAVAAPEVVEPNAMVLATVGAQGLPSARTVLLKAFEPGRGFVFFTNTASRKGRDLAANPACALVFPWHAVQRQVRVAGRTEQLDADEVATYFASRPRGARLGAWASQQSTVVASRADLERAYATAATRFGVREEDGEVPVPPTWGGYRVRPTSFEFWQGRPSRLHDRLEYLDNGSDIGGGWVRRRLAP